MKEKKTLILLIMIAVVGIVGLTIAYFTNTTSISNLFSTNPYGTTVTEVFESPDNWLPGTTTPKTIEVTNSGSVDEAVRISYTETWKSKKGNTLSGLIDSNGNLTDEEENSEHAAIINFSDNGDWNYSNGYYYYNYRLSPGNTTSSLIDSVTFNSKVKNSSNCTTTENNGVKSITCNSTNSGYDGATYTLTFTIETVQFDKYMNAWGTDVAILSEQTLFCDYFEVGEVVEYNNAEYYVLKDSSTSDDYVTLLKKDPLTANEVNQFSTDYVSQDGEYPYYTSDTCNENNQTGCSTNYDTSDVKKIIDGWSSSFNDDLVSVDGYKTRLVNYDDLFSSLYYHADIIDTSSRYYATIDTPKWSYINNIRYWSTINLEGTNNQVLNVSRNLISENTYNNSYIRPIINLKKSVINGACSNKKNEYSYCAFGEEVTYDNQKYYVLEESDNTKKYVTLLKTNLLTANEVNQYSVDYVSQDGEYPYLETSTCNSNDSSGCVDDYDTSSLKIIIDGWSNKYNNDLIKFNGNVARLINENEINNFNYNLAYRANGTYYITKSSTTPIWAYDSEKNYWVFPYFFLFDGSVLNNIGENIENDELYEKNYIRPVINLKKSAIESGCGKGNNSNNYTTYSIRETINYNNSSYCVIKNSDNAEDYVTLLKQEPLTYDELVIYNNGYQLGRDSVDNNIGTISYYKSDTCYYNDENDKNTSGCSNDYNNSFIKDILNNWSNSFNSSLKEVDGYKVRLIKNSELNWMGHQFIDKTGATKIIKSDYDCLYSNADYWTMSSSNDSIFYSDIVSKTDGNNGYQYVDKKYAVRPVINLKKCVLTNSCD